MKKQERNEQKEAESRRKAAITLLENSNRKLLKLMLIKQERYIRAANLLQKRHLGVMQTLQKQYDKRKKQIEDKYLD